MTKLFGLAVAAFALAAATPSHAADCRQLWNDWTAASGQMAANATRPGFSSDYKVAALAAETLGDALLRHDCVLPRDRAQVRMLNEAMRAANDHMMDR